MSFDALAVYAVSRRTARSDRMSYVLTRGEIATQLDAIHAKVTDISAGLDTAQLNWQPDNGRRWSIAQCLDHLAKTTALYGTRLEVAIDSAPAGEERNAAYPNLLGLLLIWSIEPPARIRIPARPELQPPSTLNPAEVRREFSDSLDYLSNLAARALRIDASRVKYANPLAANLRAFNVATGILVMLAHNRRHLHQALRVRQHRNFPAHA
jgi:hypothetical protein